MNVRDYAALKHVPVGPVWFLSEELMKLRLIAPGISQWRSTEDPLHAERLAQFADEQTEKQENMRASDLADWYASQRGAVTATERAALYDEACQQLFGSLLTGGFIDHNSHPRVQPLLLNESGQSSMSPVDAEKFRGIYWAGAYDRDGMPILSIKDLRALILDVWLPVHLIPNWCRRKNIELPPWVSSPPENDTCSDSQLSRSSTTPEAATPPALPIRSDVAQPLRPAPEDKIHAAIVAVYDHAAARSMKPPNLKEIAKPVLGLLGRSGWTTTANRIEKIAEQYRDRRLKAGVKAAKFLPFSDLEI